MTALLTTTEYPAIRAAIDTSLDTDVLPDSIIALDIYAPSAQRDVLALDATAEDRTGDELQHAKNAAIYFCAARLIGALPQISRETGFDGSGYQRQAVDTAARAAELRGRASAELDAYLESGNAASDMPTMFAAGCGQRGRW
jgi:hypothetical protein